MKSIKQTGRIVGVLFLLVFIMGVTIYQFLQSPLFADNFLTATTANSNQIIISTLLGILIGVIDIIIAILLFPIFKRQNLYLAFTYLAFCIFNFIAIAIDNVSVLSLLELSKEFVNNGGENNDTLEILGALIYQKHWWTHYLSLLISCLPVFILYYTMYISRLIPRAISIFGIGAVILMFVEILFSIFGHSISMNMLMPIGLVQLSLPIWLMIKGFDSSFESSDK